MSQDYVVHVTLGRKKVDEDFKLVVLRQKVLEEENTGPFLRPTKARR